MDKSKRKILETGARVGPCEVIELIGHGGMGDVYHATHLSLNKSVALKLLAEELISEPECVEGFLREARLASRLEDEFIVQIYDVGTDGPHHYIVMQLARGMSLRDRLRQGQLEVSKALEIIEKIARGMQVAHEQNIVHRDIKPHNVILSEDEETLKILDFGLAQFEQSLCEPEQVGEIVGSCAYMAPEQSDYANVDARADIYALGVTAFQCLTGSLPFSGTSEGGSFELLARQHFEQASAPTLINRAVPLTVSRVVLKMMEKLPDQRYGSSDELLDELRLLRRHSLPAVAWPWDSRPLNPASLAPGLATAEVFRSALVKQRDAFREGRPRVPLPAQMDDLGLAQEDAGESIAPADLIKLEPENGHAVSLAEMVPNGTSYSFGQRFKVSSTPAQLNIAIDGSRPLDPIAAQYLYDLLEAMPQWPGDVNFSVAPDYVVQPQDVRWVVDVFNICGSRGARLTLVVGSSKNHDTFRQLGLDQHINLVLELESAPSGSGSSHAVAIDTPVGEEESCIMSIEGLPASARALAAKVEQHLSRGEIGQAVRCWRQLAGELDSRELQTLKSLQNQLGDELIELGNQALELDDLETANERFNTLVDLAPNRHEGHFGKAMVLKKEGKSDYAIAFLTQAILAAPDIGELFYHRAIIRSRQDDDQGALKDLNMAIEHNPRDANSYFNRSLISRKLGYTDRARSDMNIAQRLNPELKKSPRFKPKSAARDG